MWVSFELNWSNKTTKTQASKLFRGCKWSCNMLKACFGITNYSNYLKEALTSVWFSHKWKEGLQGTQEIKMTPKVRIECKIGCIYR